MTTECLNCGKVLTNALGERLASANFDSKLPTKDVTEDGTVWARCDVCFAVAKKQRTRPSRARLLWDGLNL